VKGWCLNIDIQGNIFHFASRAIFLGTLGGRAMFQDQRTLFQSLQSAGASCYLTVLKKWTHWKQNWRRKTLHSFV